jgi:uncharacterized protein with beta-barrel porin domain
MKWNLPHPFRVLTPAQAAAAQAERAYAAAAAAAAAASQAAAANLMQQMSQQEQVWMRIKRIETCNHGVKFRDHLGNYACEDCRS